MVSSQHPKESKLSIYDEPEVPVIVVEEPTRLETLGKHLRGVLRSNLNCVQNQIQGLVNEWIHVEQKVETTVKQVVPRTEKVFPGAFYILVSGMAGSIFARNRNVLFKIAAPISFATASSFYFLPQTSRSVTFHLLRKIEDNKTAKAEVTQIQTRLSKVAADISHKANQVAEDVGASVEKQKIHASVLAAEAKMVKSEVEDTVSEMAHNKKKQADNIIENSKERMESLVTKDAVSEVEENIAPRANEVIVNPNADNESIKN